MIKISLSLLGLVGLSSYGQEFDANIQLRPRYEYRNGFKTLLKDNDLPTSFISQRSRINFNFKQEKLKVKLTLQNVRTWGDVATKTTADKNGIGLFEAYAQYDFNAKWSARIGRQVISYDNQRIFGEIDWAQEGQSHDAAVFSYHPTNHQLDFGIASNANAENLLEPATAYTTNYKQMQFAWYHTQFGKLGMSLLVLNTGYQYAKTSTELNIANSQTYGTFLTYKTGKWDTNLGLYGQSGKKINAVSTDTNTLNAYYAGLNLGYAVNPNFKATLGYELLSGKNQNDTSSDNKSFTPIFGTNHGFNGYMDYFYVGNHLNSVGLQDVFLKLNYTHNKWQFNLMPHLFSAPAKVYKAGNKLSGNLGTELDFTTSYAVQKDITFTAGYSQMFASSTLKFLKGGINNSYTNNWVFVMVSINPRIFTSK
ncbi:hypothetical protein DB895_10410 [Flavobacterium psychrotolerans]|uniref:Alginate export domain-containing protein n=1 Tax=Flavobacterium psychrotolerans TaxID=2169410 RepID=A0A2U1JIH9_9FLAO|nr:hypothetical protein DB895_10410 [Flavobacterium psychrotolerans]